MKKYKLSESDQKQIAHLMANRSIATIGPGEPTRALEKYLDTFNDTMMKLEEYNKTTD